MESATLLDSVSIAYSAIMSAPIDTTAVMYTVLIIGVVISLYNVITGISIYRKEKN